MVCLQNEREVVRDFLPSLLKRKVPNTNVQPSLTKQVLQFEDYLYQPENFI